MAQGYDFGTEVLKASFLASRSSASGRIWRITGSIVVSDSSSLSFGYQFSKSLTILRAMSRVFDLSFEMKGLILTSVMLCNSAK